MKVVFEVPKLPSFRADGTNQVAVKAGLPFFYNARTHRTHGIRDAVSYYRDCELSHTTFKLFCNGTGFASLETRHVRNRMVETPLGEMCPLCQAKMMVKGVWPA